MNLTPNFRHGCGYALMIIRAMAPSYRGYKYIILDPNDPGEPPSPIQHCPNCGRNLLYTNRGIKRHYKPNDEPGLQDLWVEHKTPLDGPKAVPIGKIIDTITGEMNPE